MTRRRVLLVSCFGLAVVAMIGAWFWLPQRSTTSVPFQVILEASHDRVLPLGTVTLTARVEPASVPTLSYEWTATRGVLVARSARATLVAPALGDTTTVTVVAADGRGGTARDSKQIQIIALPQAMARHDPLYEPLREPLREPLQVPAGSGYSLAFEFEKPEICWNDDVLIRVTADDPLGQRDWLRTRVLFGGADLGGTDTVVGRVPFIYDDTFRSQIAAGKMPPVVIEVFDGRSGQKVARQEVQYPIRNDCAAERRGLGATCQQNSDKASCFAWIYPDVRFEPERYEWDFGDGSPVIHTASKEVTHELAKTTQTAMYSTFLVRVKAFDRSGEWLETRYSLIVSNPEWDIMRRTGRLTLRVRWDGYPERGDDGGYRSRVSIQNPFAEAVRLTELRLTHAPCREGGEARPRSASPESLVGRSVLGPGEAVEVLWEERQLHGDTCAIQALLSGEGTDTSLPAAGEWVMPVGPGQRVSPGVERRLRQALSILSRRRGHPVTRITPEDLRQLEEEGLLPAAPEGWDPVKGSPATGKP